MRVRHDFESVIPYARTREQMRRERRRARRGGVGRIKCPVHSRYSTHQVKFDLLESKAASAIRSDSKTIG